jgi:two-component system, OmpR family, response regulator
MQPSIFYVEDDAAIRENYAELLRAEGYDVTTCDSVPCGEGLLGSVPTLLLLDMRLGADAEGGLTLCRTGRERSQCLPIVFLSSHDQPDDVRRAIDAGADDYIAKDVQPAQLLERISRRIARALDRSEQPLCDGNLSVDRAGCAVRWRDEPVALNATQIALLTSLVAAPGTWLAAAELSEAALCDGAVVLEAHIQRIATKFREVDRAFDCLQFERRAGRWNSQGAKVR